MKERIELNEVKCINWKLAKVNMHQAGQSRTSAMET